MSEADVVIRGVYCDECEVNTRGEFARVVRPCDAHEVDEVDGGGGKPSAGPKTTAAFAERGWVSVRSDVALYVQERTRIPLVLVRGLDGNVLSLGAFVPRWAAAFLALGSAMKKAKLSVGAVPSTRQTKKRPAPGAFPDLLLDWPVVLNTLADDDEVRDAVEVVLKTLNPDDPETPGSLYGFLVAHLPAPCLVPFEAALTRVGWPAL
jgi:hypothetical protein